MPRRQTALFLFLFLLTPLLNARRGDAPTIEETEAGKTLILPEKVAVQVEVEFPGAAVVPESELNPEMLRYFYLNIIGLHPSIAWGDFNGDKKTDYALLLKTGETPWGPLVELVVFNGRKKNEFDTFRLGEIYGHKDDYLRHNDGQLYKGKYRKGGWYIHWDAKKKEYVVNKS